MKTAIVGFGTIGKVHYDVLNELGISICAICDNKLEKLTDLPVNTYSDYNVMLEKEKPDVVHICTPHFLHADMIISALERDINVLCEKPLCIKEEDIDRILLAEKNSNAVLGVCHQNRYNKENAFVKEYLADKKVVCGHGEQVWTRTKEYYAQDIWRGKWQTEGGGVLINQSLHTLDLLIWVLGEPQEVVAHLDNVSLKGVIEVEDTASLICSNGGNFTFFATNASKTDFPVALRFLTDKERVEILPQKVIIEDKVFNFEPNAKVYGKACYGVGHERLFIDYYDALKNNRKFAIDGLEASKVIRVILKAYKQWQK